MAQKWPKITQNSPKMTQNCQNGPKISTSWKNSKDISAASAIFASLCCCSSRCGYSQNLFMSDSKTFVTNCWYIQNGTCRYSKVFYQQQKTSIKSNANYRPGDTRLGGLVLWCLKGLSHICTNFQVIKRLAFIVPWCWDRSWWLIDDTFSWDSPRYSEPTGDQLRYTWSH